MPRECLIKGDATRCSGRTADNTLAYQDDNHLSVQAARLLAPRYAQALSAGLHPPASSRIVSQ
jgi:hypothetical protein